MMSATLNHQGPRPLGLALRSLRATLLVVGFLTLLFSGPIGCQTRLATDLTGRISGQVIHRPTDDSVRNPVLKVELVETWEEKDKPRSVTIARTLIEQPDEAQPFELTYNPERIDPSRIYVLRAELRQRSGPVVQVQRRPVRVLIRERPERATLVLNPVAGSTTTQDADEPSP